VKARQIEKLGIPRALSKQAKWLVSEARERGESAEAVKARLAAIVADPEAHRDDEQFGSLAAQVALHQRAAAAAKQPEIRGGEPAPCRTWGESLDPKSVAQVEAARRLPVAVAAALMPDAHVGYGLPIGGVLAVENAVIPYAVGVDIACRMRLTVLDLPPDELAEHPDRFRDAIERETRFGVGASFTDAPRDHPVLEADWNVSPITRAHRDRAWSQLGSSGSGNHFVEFGRLSLDRADLGLEAGEYLALLSHSGSRGAGAAVADHYSGLAMMLHPTLPETQRRLAWLDLDSHEGLEYWAAMSLMGDYAAANHEVIHRHVVRALGARAVAKVENHHNFAWRETHVTPDGETRDLIVHRKGHAGGRGRAGRHPRVDGEPRIRGPWPGRADVAAVGLARRGPRDEPASGTVPVQVGRRRRAAPRPGRGVALRGDRRGAARVQRHRAGDGGSA